MSKEELRNQAIKDEDDEQELLTAAALRFDGYRYYKEKEIDTREALEQYKKNPKIPDSPMEQLAIFFLLQRSLLHWGGYEKLDSLEWQTFRKLFLLNYQTDIPEKYKNADYAKAWQDKFLPEIEDEVAFINRRLLKYSKNQI